MTHDETTTDRGTWADRLVWLEGADPATELQQAREEGRVLGDLEATLGNLIDRPPGSRLRWRIDMDRSDAWRDRVIACLDAVQAAPLAKDWPYTEPDGLAEIHAARPAPIELPRWRGSDEDHQQRSHGGLLGRLCGCLLGKPIEHFSRRSIRAFAEATGNWPIRGYFARPTEAQMRSIRDAGADRLPRLELQGQYAGEIDRMPFDDDVNYTVMGHAIVERFGPAFTPLDVGFMWLSQMPLELACTAERVAYRNLANAILPPHSATRRNPYREWIGAQIRADYFGYANPADPQRAADWAWRDASISHVRNGIYGEMWVAAMLAAAFVLDDWPAIIRAGLSQIPQRSRLTEAIRQTLARHANGASWEQTIAAIHQRWDEHDEHQWCHTIPNAQVVAAALLYGQDNFSDTIALAVTPGYDTDCNAATAGSVFGVRHGPDAIAAQWSAPLQDRSVSSVSPWQTFRISELAGRMAITARRNHGSEAEMRRD